MNCWDFLWQPEVSYLYWASEGRIELWHEYRLPEWSSQHRQVISNKGVTQNTHYHHRFPWLASYAFSYSIPLLFQCLTFRQTSTTGSTGASVLLVHSRPSIWPSEKRVQRWGVGQNVAYAPLRPLVSTGTAADSSWSSSLCCVGTVCFAPRWPSCRLLQDIGHKPVQWNMGIHKKEAHSPHLFLFFSHIHFSSLHLLWTLKVRPAPKS